MYGNMVSGAVTTRDTSFGAIGVSEDRAARDYGLGFTRTDTNKDGKIDSKDGVDPNSIGKSLVTSDPFSKMALLQRSYEQNKSGDMNSYAAMGQLQSGAMQRQKAETMHNRDMGEDQIRKAFEDMILGAASDRIGVNTQYTTSVNDAAAERLRLALGG
jgi:hypothetical protein